MREQIASGIKQNDWIVLDFDVVEVVSNSFAKLMLDFDVPTKISQQEAIDGIEGGKWQFYVTRNGATVNVIITKSANGNNYIKTENDSEQPNNLLSLPECP